MAVRISRSDAILMLLDVLRGEIDWSGDLSETQAEIRYRSRLTVNLHKGGQWPDCKEGVLEIGEV